MTKRDEPATKPLTPKPETQEVPKKSKGMTRKGFGQLLKRAFSPDSAKPAPKSK